MTYYSILGSIALLTALLLSLGALLDSIYKRGYAKGRKAADDWWINVECSVDKARQEIWREERRPGHQVRWGEEQWP